MGLQSANNAKALIQGTVLASDVFLTVKDSKGGLFPSVYPYRCTLTKFVNGIVTQREIVEVTSKTGSTFTITRGVEACPANDVTAITQTTTAFKFDDNDSFQLTRPVSKDTEIDGRLTIVETDKLDKTTYDSEKALFVSSSTGTDAYQITDPYNTTLVDGKTYKVQADVANTGAATLQVNALAVKGLKKMSGGFTDLLTGDIVINQIFWATYNLAEDVFQFSVDPAGAVTIPSASESVEGVIEIASSAEVLAGNDLSRAVNSKYLKDHYGFSVIPGTITLTSLTALDSTNSLVYVKMKEVLLSKGGTYAVSFTLKRSGSGTAYGRIYRNGVAIGTERSTPSDGYVTFTENITVSDGDLMQLYLRHDNATYSAQSDNMTLKFDIIPNLLGYTINNP